MEEYLEAMGDDMSTALGGLTKQLAKIRTGRATPKLVDGVQVMIQSYGTTMPLNQLATVQAADARLLTITPWDKTTLHDIERAIVGAGLGLNPSNDGNMIRLPVPPLTQDRRKELVRQARKVGEDAKVRIRQIRKEYNDLGKESEKDGDITEDQMHRFMAKVQESTDKQVAQVDVLVQSKEAEVLEI